MSIKGSFVVFFLFLGVFTFGCASMKATAKKIGSALHLVSTPEPKLAKTPPTLYRDGLLHLEQQDFKNARREFEEFLSRVPTSPWTQSALVNRGRALEGLELWMEAADQYQVVVSSTNDFPELQVFALYRLSFCLEALNRDQEDVAVLFDVYQRQKFLDSRISTAELPARMAAAYARVGNFEKAKEFYTQAERGMNQLEIENRDTQVPDWMGRTFYQMGQTTHRYPSWLDFEVHLRPLARGQMYLLRAAELGVEPWAQLAADELIEKYLALWSVLMNASPLAQGDPVLEMRDLQMQQWQRVGLISTTLNELKSRIIPSDQRRSKEADNIVKFVSQLETEIEHYATHRPFGEGLTDEALERRQSIRGKVIEPDDSLEKLFKQTNKTSTHQLPQKKKIKEKGATVQELPESKIIESEPAQDLGDPNL